MAHRERSDGSRCWRWLTSGVGAALLYICIYLAAYIFWCVDVTQLAWQGATMYVWYILLIWQYIWIQINMSYSGCNAINKCKLQIYIHLERSCFRWDGWCLKNGEIDPVGCWRAERSSRHFVFKLVVAMTKRWLIKGLTSPSTLSTNKPLMHKCMLRPLSPWNMTWEENLMQECNKSAGTPAENIITSCLARGRLIAVPVARPGLEVLVWHSTPVHRTAR